MTRKKLATKVEGSGGENASEASSPVPADVSRKFPVVGMGASAGGLEAFQSFFSHMPPDSGMAFVLVQHLDPRHATLMPELLARNTAMPVAPVQDKTPVEPNHIYVIPPNAALTIEGSVLRLQTPVQRQGVRAPIDIFFRSLAEDQGEHALCVLLSGSGTDGTLGVRAVKEHGGMAMAQAAESAKHDSMPRSAIATGLVDYVLPAEQMPAKLVEYAAYLNNLQEEKGLKAIREEAADNLAKICVLLRRRTGQDFSLYKQATLVRRIQRRMQVVQAPTGAGYLERLREDPKEAEQLFKDLLIGVTHFFRDPQAFEVLGREVIPRILDGAGDSLRIWTPGCATGEEAYSVAILVREQMGNRDRLRVQIFAGDIDEEALDVARQATYPEGIANQVAPERLERFFVRHDHSYEVTKIIREMCIFSTHNLIKDPPFSRVDLIVCRNLLIYLEPLMQRHVTQLFHYALRPGGYLFLGPSENIVGAPDLFRALDKTHRIFQRNETLVRPPLSIPLPAAHLGRPANVVSLGTAARLGKEAPASVQVLERLLVQHFSPAWVVINSHGDVVYFSPRTGRYLEPPPGAPSTNLIDMARKSIRLDLRTAVHQAHRTGSTVTREDLIVEANGEMQRINLIVRPVRELGEDNGLLMVVFQELGPPRSRQETEAEDQGSTAGDSIAQQLESELRMTKEHLQATVEELETSNEELTSSNEELLSTNEELQSSNEELQTSKEEMQSVNEELETINAELAKKVEQLDSAHSDLQNLFESTQVASVYLDKELHIKKFTPAATQVFRLVQTDVGRSINDIVPRFTDSNLPESVRDVVRNFGARERLVQLADGSATYMARILPYRSVSNVIDGVVLTFVDVTALTRAQTRQAELAAIVESSLDAIVAHDPDGIITTWNASAARMFGYNAQEAVGKSISLIVPPEKHAESENLHARVRRGELVEPFESVRLTREGHRLPVSILVSAIRNTQGQISGASASFRDLTGALRAKETLQSEILHRDQFMAVLSHELRGPMAPLRMSLDVLRMPAASLEQAEKAKAMMERQLGQLTNLVDQLLDVSRISRGKIAMDMKVVNLTQLLTAVVDDYRVFIESQGLVFNVKLPQGGLWVHGDSTRLTQAVGNVLHNAGKFTDQGSVDFDLGHDESRRWAVLIVRDSGTGMNAEQLADLFQPFRQADRTLDRTKGGLGLGLVLTKGLIESHGGTVEAHSNGIGSGSQFTIRLPLIQGARMDSPEPAREATKAAPSKENGEPWRVLVVEDNPDAGDSLRFALELSGYEVRVAPDGNTALELAQKIKPNVVLCDIGLPGSMDGYAVAAAFRADPALTNTHLVALTGYGREQDQSRALKAGFELHLRKPTDIAALRRAIASLRGRR